MDIVQGELTYEKLDRIGVGQGLNSEVYRAREIGMDRTVAVKEITKADLSVRGIHDFFREARMLFNARHNHVAEIYTAVETNELVSLVMPLYERGSLASRIAQGPLSPSTVVRIAHEVLLGLGVVHMRNMVHFDLKPTNVLFAPNGRAMVADFGQTRMLNDLGVAEEPAMYPYAVPPEVERFHAATSAADIWQMGLLMYRALNGDPFYHHVKAEQLDKAGNAAACRRSGKIVDLAQFQPHVPLSLRRVIKRAMSVQPTERFESAEQFSDVLGRAIIPLNWEMATEGTVLVWRVERRGKAPLVVRVEQASNDRKNVQVYTEGTNGLRACGKAEMWAEGLTVKQAEQHLRVRVFTQLGRR
jgi:serine/threonine protein kinase